MREGISILEVRKKDQSMIYKKLAIVFLFLLAYAIRLLYIILFAVAVVQSIKGDLGRAIWAIAWILLIREAEYGMHSHVRDAIDKLAEGQDDKP